VAAIGFELRGSLDVRGADVAASAAELGIAGDVAGLNEAARGVGVQVSGHVDGGDVSALSLEFCDGHDRRCGEVLKRADAPGGDVAARGYQQRVATNIRGLNVA